MQSLLDKYLDGTITELERQALYILLNNPIYEKQLGDIISKELHEHAFEGKPDASILSSLLSHLNECKKNSI